MTAINKYSLLKRDNFRRPLHMQQTKGFLLCLGIVLKFTSNFEHFENKYDPHGYLFSELAAAKDVVM